MSLMLIRRGIEALVGAALVVAILLAVLPAVAEAQSTPTTPQEEAAPDAKGGASERSVVVAPGDSLWSISAERLGAGATPQRIAKNVERVYALNRDQIGPNPNLIIVGQRLSLPPMGSEEVAHANAKTPPSATREDAGRTAAAAATTPKRGQADSRATVVRGEGSQASRTTIEAGQGAANKTKTHKAPAAAAADNEPPQLPKAPEDAARPVPNVRQEAAAEEDSPTISSPLASFLRSVRSIMASAPSAVGEALTEVREAASDRRTTLGWVIVVLTVVVGVLMAWKLPMKRTTRWDAQRRGIPTGYPNRLPTTALKPTARERESHPTETSKQRSAELAKGGR